MSSPIWTPAALSSELRAYETGVWRVVEAQHLVSTRKIVDTNAEQLVLEELIEPTKPAVPDDRRGLDYLLFTPFRYGADYPRGSRFRRAGRTAGVYCAAENSQTAITEMAFYRLLFFAESPRTPWPANPGEYTAFAAAVRSLGALDLTAPPLAANRELWTDPSRYEPCQALAEAARAAGAEVLRYESVRDPQRRAAVAVMVCAAFAKPHPLAYETWRIGVGGSGAYAMREAPVDRLEFDRDVFAADARIAAMAWERSP